MAKKKVKEEQSTVRIILESQPPVKDSIEDILSQLSDAIDAQNDFILSMRKDLAPFLTPNPVADCMTLHPQNLPVPLECV